MKLISATIHPFKLDAVRDAIFHVGLSITAIEALGFGRQKGHSAVYRGSEYAVDFRPKVRIEIAVDDDEIDAVVEAISKAARAGSVGDGKIFVVDLDHAIRIRTGETGTDAL